MSPAQALQTDWERSSPRVAELVHAASVAAIITDPRLPDNPIVDCNDRFLKLTGYGREEVVGRNCRFLVGPETDPARRRMLRDAIETQRPIIVELLNYRKDGTPFLNSVMIAPLYDSGGSLVGFVGSQLEVLTDESAFVSAREQLARGLVARLSPRQREVLSRLAEGKRVKQIAHELGLGERTVKMHRAAMLKSLGVRTNAEAIRLAVRAGL
jgi:PAS domain S-box-containing protein